MKQIYKAGGDWVTEKGVKYTANTVNESELSKYLSSGWVLSLDKLPKRKSKKGA